MIAALLSGLLVAASTPTLTLDQALRDAGHHNPDIKVMQARLAQAHELSKKLWASYLPQLTAGGSYTYNSVEASISLPVAYYIDDACPPEVRQSAPNLCPKLDKNPPDDRLSGTSYVTGNPAKSVSAVIQKQHQWGGQVELSQAILAPQLWPAIQAAYLGEDAAELTVTEARREVLFAVAKVYYGAVAAKEALSVQQELLATDRAHVADAQVKVDAGAVPKIVLLRAQIDEASAEQDVTRAKDAFLSAKSALASLLDREPDFDVVAPPDPPAPPSMDELRKDATRRPDVLAAEKSEAAAEKGALSTKLAYLPNLGLQAAYRAANVAGFTGSNTSWFVTLGLNWTLFDGGLREANLRESDAKLGEAEAQLESARMKAEDELRRARLDYEDAVANEAKATEQAKLAKENAQLVQVAFAAGTATQLEVADASTQLQRAELGRIAQTLDAQLAVLELAKAAGTFDPK